MKTCEKQNYISMIISGFVQMSMPPNLSDMETKIIFSFGYDLDYY